MITIRHTSTQGTTMQGFTFEDTDAGNWADNIISGHGFRHGPNGLHLPKTVGNDPKSYVIEACAAGLRNAGFTVTVDIEGQ